MAIPLQAATAADPLEQKIRMPRLKGTIYQLLNQISERTDYLFIYDSRILNNEQKTSIDKGEYTIREAIHLITGNPKLEFQLIDKHILISLPASETLTQAVSSPVQKEMNAYFTISGSLFDQETHEPIIYASVGVSQEGIGTITNQDGEFKLRLPVSLLSATLTISHLGYRPVTISCSIFADKYSSFSLEPNTISLDEIVVHPVNPILVLHDMLDKRYDNYMDKPVMLTTFYREGIERKKGIVSLSEGVFKVYKTPFSSLNADQVKLLKMRKVTNQEERDTIITKIKSGINACLLLDLVKKIPDFLRAEIAGPYAYSHASVTVIDNQFVDVIAFEQKKGYTDPLYKGELYIDKASKALIKAEFQIQPEYIKKATNMFVERKSRHLQITPLEVKYTVSYKPLNGRYYINHVRGDLSFKIKKKKLLASSTTIHTWFEMVTCKLEQQEVSRFARSETLPTRTIFSDTSFRYDEQFWGDFNIIIPENELNEAIQRISSKIEETGD